jgi:cyclohexa-1,5-dienecarbonyl-CoA hydratase
VTNQPGSSPVETTRFEEGRVLCITLNRPPANILSRAMMAAIDEALAEARNDPALKLVVLRGSGGNFSYGASVEEHRRDRAAELLRDFHAFARWLAACPVPVAALIEGRCLGGAFETALLCHFLFAAPGAVLGCPEIRLGVFPPVLAAVGPLRLGGSLAERLLLTGNSLTAEEASRLGLLTALLEGEDPFEALLAWYRRDLAPLSAFALREAVAASRAGSGLTDALGDRLDTLETRYLERLLPSHDGNEGIEAFLARRPAVWRDA